MALQLQRGGQWTHRHRPAKSLTSHFRVHETRTEPEQSVKLDSQRADIVELSICKVSVRNSAHVGGNGPVMKPARRASVLAVYAHPDDELFHGGGLLAHLADRGARVTLACATRGEAGKAHPSVGQVDDVGAHRAEELRASCARLGIG